MTQWVKFNDGEALTFGDLNDLQHYIRRLLLDGLLLNSATYGLPWMTNGSTGEQLRPYGYSGAMIRTSASNVRVNGGLWLYSANTATLDGSEPVSLVAFDTAYTNLAVSAASAGKYSRDIIQTRVVEADDATVARDFQDAVTGALSSQSMVKRTACTVQHMIKAGAEYASVTDVVEATPDAGYIKTGSVLVDDTGIMANTYTFDWRVPFGNSTHLVTVADMIYTTGAWTTAAGAGGYYLVSAGGANIPLIVPIGHDRHAAASLAGMHYTGASRVLTVDLTCDLTGLPLINDHATFGRLQASTTGIDYPPDVGAANGSPSVGLRINNTAFGTYALFNNVSYATDPPLWTNGAYSALAQTTISRLMLYFDTVGTGDKIYSLSYLLAG